MELFFILQMVSVSSDNSINQGYKQETQQSLSITGRAGENGNFWQQIQQLAKRKSDQQMDTNPPKRQGHKPCDGCGGPRTNAGRKKSIPKVSSDQ